MRSGLSVLKSISNGVKPSASPVKEHDINSLAGFAATFGKMLAICFGNNDL